MAARGSDRGIPQSLSCEKVYVRLTDFANVSGRLRAEAEGSVQRMFLKAGVAPAFVECETAGAPCAMPAASRDLRLQILKDRPKNIAGDPTGFAVLVHTERLCDSYGAVSFVMVEAMARDMNAPVADVLAAAMAHELGHLLLQSSSHGRTGIMKKRLDPEQVALMGQGSLLFTDAEAAAMTARLRRVLP
jgi:hypothetical protein